MKKRFLWVVLTLLLLLPATAFAAETPPYRITVNLTKNIVTVYGKDADGIYTEPVQAFVCSVGKYTPTGTFRTTDKYVWRPLVGGVYGQYATRITGHILFHSVPYFEQDKSTLEYLEYNKLGTTASAGCVRLSAADAKWIYDNCPSGTTVEMYYGGRTEPIQPQKAVKIDVSDSRRGWDPTDPDPANPWGVGTAEAETNTEKPEQNQTEAAEPAKTEEKTEDDGLEVFSVQTAHMKEPWEVKGKRTGSDYFLTAADAKRVYAHMGVTLLLPQQAEGETADALYQKETFAVPVQKIAGQTYYSLRSLAEPTGTVVQWRSGGMSFYRHGEELRLDRAPA